jgi:hypothetical protein
MSNNTKGIFRYRLSSETFGYILVLDRRRNDILEELEVDTVETTLAQYKQKWLNHVSSGRR